MRVPLLAVLMTFAVPAQAAVVVVLPIGDDPALTSEVRGALAPHVSVQPAAATAESLAAAKSLGIACNPSSQLVAPTCLSELGGLAGGDLVVGGSVIPMPEGAHVTLRLVEVATGRLVRSAEALLPPTAGPRARALRILAVRLVAPEKERGSISIFAPAGAALQIDDVPVGTAPLAKPVDVQPGRREVYAALPGRISASAFIDVDVGEHATVSLDLRPDADGDGEPDPVGTVGTGSTARADDTPTQGGLVGIIAVEGNIDPALRSAVADAVAWEVSKLEGHDVMGLAEVERELPENIAVMLSCREEGCHAMVGRHLGLEDIIVVEVARTDDESALVVRRFSGKVGRILRESVHDGLGPTDDDIARAVGPAVQNTFPLVRLRDGEVRGIDTLVEASAARPGKRPPLPPWVFWSALATTGVAATTSGALAAWSAVERGPSQDAVTLSMWVAIGATAALVAADVAVALSTDWSRP